MKKFKRLLVVADTHCGVGTGLTAPEYYDPFYKDINRVGWEYYANKVNELNPDIVLCNGDLVDGPGRKDSADHITTDMGKQVKMAIRVLEEIKKVNPKVKFIFTRGSGYHVKTDTEHEDYIAAHFEEPIKDSVKFDINGLLIHARHVTGKGGTVYSSMTSFQRSSIVTMLNDVFENKESASLYIRSHIHELNVIRRSGFTGLTTPCMQFKGSTYGRNCTGFYDYGLSWVDIVNGTDYQVYYDLLKLTSGRKEEVIKL